MIADALVPATTATGSAPSPRASAMAPAEARRALMCRLMFRFLCVVSARGPSGQTLDGAIPEGMGCFPPLSLRGGTEPIDAFRSLFTVVKQGFYSGI
ncbi:hypothetical protein GCM10010407_05670 [Rarobacter incanus]